MNKKDIQTYFDIHDELGLRAEQIAIILHTGKISGYMEGDYKSFDIDGDDVEVSIECESTCSCCASDYDTVRVPKSLLLAGDNWKEEALTFYKNREAERKRLQAEAEEKYKIEKAERNINAAKSKVTREKKELQRLKKIYED